MSGTFNSWARLPLTRSHDDFSTVLYLEPDEKYTFRFNVDGEWRTSPDLPTQIDERGMLVNYVEVANVRTLA